MSEPAPTDPEPGGTVWDAPNQQTVREDSSPPWQEGTGGGGSPDPQEAAPRKKKTADNGEET